MSKGDNMTTSEKIKELGLPGDTKVNLKLSEGTDVFHYNETEIDTALENTSVVSEYVDLILTAGLNLETTWGENPVTALRDQGLLEDYERDGTFDDYLKCAIYDNFYDAEVIEYSTEKYDHKRGFTTLTAELYTTSEDIVKSGADLSSWTVTVETKAGDLILN